MKQTPIEFRVSSRIWFSLGDEASFFSWLSKIEGYISSHGTEWVLAIRVSPDKIDRRSMQEFVALFRRYQVEDMKQLRALSSCADGEWFADPKMYWHSAIFGEDG